MGYVPPHALSKAILEDRRGVVENRLFNAPGDSLERPVAGDSCALAMSLGGGCKPRSTERGSFSASRALHCRFTCSDLGDAGAFLQKEDKTWKGEMIL